MGEAGRGRERERTGEGGRGSERVRETDRVRAHTEEPGARWGHQDQEPGVGGEDEREIEIQRDRGGRERGREGHRERGRGRGRGRERGRKPGREEQASRRERERDRERGRERAGAGETAEHFSAPGRCRHGHLRAFSMPHRNSLLLLAIGDRPVVKQAVDAAPCLVHVWCSPLFVCTVVVCGPLPLPAAFIFKAREDSPGGGGAGA